MNNTPTIEPEQHLKLLALEVQDYQIRNELSDAGLCKKFPDLGSTKTYKRILGDDFAEMTVDRQIKNYSEVCALIKALGETEMPAEPEYPDFPHVVAVRAAVADALAEPGNDRIVFVQGGSGSGKSTTRRILKEKWPNAVVSMEADESWESFYNMIGDMILECGQILRTKGEVEVPFSLEARRTRLIELLTVRKRILDIDEGHHMGPRSLNFIKTIINRTPSVVVIYALPKLWSDLEKKAFTEASQLSLNRLKEKVIFSKPAKQWIATFLSRRGVKFTTESIAKRAAEDLVNSCASRGEWKFVNLVCRKCLKAMEVSDGNPIDLTQFIAAQSAVIKTR